MTGQSFSKGNLGKAWNTHQNNARTVLRSAKRVLRYTELAEHYKRGSRTSSQSGAASSMMDAPEMYEPSSPMASDG